MLFFNRNFVDNIVYIIGVVISLLGVFKLPEAFLNKAKYPSVKSKLLHIFEGVLHYLVGGLLLVWSQFFAIWLAQLVGAYQLLMGTITFINYLLLRKDRVPRRFNQLIIASYNLIFGLFSLFDKADVTDTLLRLGLYLVFVGLTGINDGRRLLLSEVKENRLKRRLRVSVPVFFTMLLPHDTLVKINRFINDELDLMDRREVAKELKTYQVQKGEPILKVFIHTADSGFNVMGHCDLSYKGCVYAFGNYDVDSERFFGTMGDGVFVETEEKAYIDYCLEFGKTLFEYQLVLDDSKQLAFEAKLADLKEKMLPWQMETPSQKSSYMGQLQERYGARFAKFNSSRFKTYFVLGTNCVLLADQLIGTAGIDLIRMAGILSPGTYYDYFEKEFQIPNSIVVGRQLHHPKMRQVEVSQSTIKEE